jgi:predicted RNA-binding protein associated with RNAse of E/G family
MTGRAGSSEGQAASVPVWPNDTGTLALWHRLTPGAAVTIIKADADGAEVTRDDGHVRRVHSADHWIEAEAVWSHGNVALAGLRFVPGDHLLEYFSPVLPYNVFTVFAPDGALRGWYANVSHPALLRENGDKLELTWRDLYLDLIGLPDGTHITLDEDELAESGLATSNPAMYARIARTQVAVIERFKAREYPFSVVSLDGLSS